MARSNSSNEKAQKTKRPGIHSKNNTSSSKESKNFKKKYRGQGK